ncbi:MAG TPA: glycosyltransferase, partial [Allosphingosinicella sp.]
VHCLTLGDSLMAIKRKRMASPGLTDFGMNNGNAYAELWEQRRIYVDPGPDAAEEAVPAGTGAEEGTGEGLRARQGAAFPIPKIIHQTWKDADVPARYLEWQESWRALNPGYEYRLWSDNDLEALVRDRYPELLELFLSYASHICRVDLGRYLVLNSFGGVYADLDCECLRPLDGLLESREFVIGCEPQEHLALAKAAASGLSRILCPTFIASIPGHLFWDHLLGRLQEARDHEDVLDSTGPFVLTRAYESFASPSSLSVLPPSELYPVDRERCDSGQVFDLEYWEAATRDAYAIHYWDGSWWRDGSELASGIQTSCGINVVGPASPSPQGPGRPRVSCLMVVTDEDALAETSLSGFLAQTYPDKELVLIDATGSAPAWIDEAARQEGVKVLRLPRQARGAPAWTDPAWTDLALRQARGDYLCIWDADALHDPVRLEYQLAALAVGADASVIGTSIRLELDRRRLSIGAFEPWQTSFFCRRAVFAGTLARLCLNSASLEEIVNDLSVAEIDLPRLFARIGSWEDRKLSPFARNSYSGTRYGAVARELAKRLPIGQLLAREDGRPPAKHRSSYRRQTATG